MSLLSLGAVAVHAAVCGLPAGLPSHPAPHLHSQARLCAPLNRAAQLLSSCFCTHRHTWKGKRDGGREGAIRDCQSMTLNDFVTQIGSRIHRDYFCDTSACIHLLKNHCRGKKQHQNKSMNENVFRNREVLILEGRSHKATQHRVRRSIARKTAYGGLAEAVVSPRSTYKHPASAHPVLTDPRWQLTPPISRAAAHLHPASLTTCVSGHVAAPVAHVHIPTQNTQR